MFIFALQQYGISTKLISLSREQVWWGYILPVPELHTISLTLMPLSSSKHDRNPLTRSWKILPYNSFCVVVFFFLKEEIHLSCHTFLNWQIFSEVYTTFWNVLLSRQLLISQKKKKRIQQTNKKNTQTAPQAYISIISYIIILKAWKLKLLYN